MDGLISPVVKNGIHEEDREYKDCPCGMHPPKRRDAEYIENPPTKFDIAVSVVIFDKNGSPMEEETIGLPDVTVPYPFSHRFGINWKDIKTISWKVAIRGYRDDCSLCVSTYEIDFEFNR